MNLKNQKRIAAQLLKIGRSRVWFDSNRLNEIKEAITKADVKALIRDLAIQAKPITGISRFRARKIKKQRLKGRRKGTGSRKGKASSRVPRKKSWITSIRAQRLLLKHLKDKGVITLQTYRSVYKKSKSGFFRSKRHVKLYLEENNLLLKNEKK